MVAILTNTCTIGSMMKTQNSKRQTKWLVYQYSTKTYRWECIDEVYFTNDCTAEYVRNSLVNHDGYSYSIKVVQA